MLNRIGDVPAYLEQIRTDANRIIDLHNKPPTGAFLGDGATVKVTPLADGRYQLSLTRVALKKAAAVTSPPPEGTCYLYEDFWPDYYHDPTDHWKPYCIRKLIFDWDSETFTRTSAIQYLRLFGNGEPEALSSFWFTPTNAAIHNLLRTIPLQSPDILEHLGTLRLSLLIHFYRDVVSGGGVEIPVGDETSSISWVEEICFAPI